MLDADKLQKIADEAAAFEDEHGALVLIGNEGLARDRRRQRLTGLRQWFTWNATIGLVAGLALWIAGNPAAIAALVWVVVAWIGRLSYDKRLRALDADEQYR